MLFGTSAGSGRMNAGVSGRTPSRSQILGRQYQPFSNPFFDLASTYMPPSVKSLFAFCRFYYLSHGVIHAIVTKASEYPITDIIFQHKSEATVRRWEELMLDHINYRTHQFETNLDYFNYGNAFISPSYPFRKMLKCGSCRAEVRATESRQNWKYINHRFWLSCPKCGQSGFADVDDVYYPVQTEINLIRWNPENVSIFYNEATGRRDYALELSASFRSQITMGRKDLVATTPQIFLDAVAAKRSIVFNASEIFHMRRPAASSADVGWGVPLLMPVLKDAFYMQVLKKAQESVMLTHLLPQVFLFPQPATGGADPFTATSLEDWRNQLRREIARQRADPSYYGIVPFPVGHQTIGENGKSLLLMPEIQQLSEQIVVGMGFSPGLVFGNEHFAGSSVSMRMLENFFLSNVHSHKRLLAWTQKKFAAMLGWPVPTSRFKPFRMADDIQRQGLMFQLNQAGKLSDTTLLSAFDIKHANEHQQIEDEIASTISASEKRELAQAETQGRVMVVQAKYQAQAQQAMADAQVQQKKRSPFEDMQQNGANPPGASLDAVAAALAQKVRYMPEDRKRLFMSQLQEAVPGMGEMVEQHMPSEGMPQQPPQDFGGVDMRPEPEMLPPRR